jgi:hypothetical protein
MDNPPCGLVADMWIKEIIGKHLVDEGFGYRTVMAMRRTCHWFALRLSVPPSIVSIHGEVMTRDECRAVFREYKRDPAVAALFSWRYIGPGEPVFSSEAHFPLIGEAIQCIKSAAVVAKFVALVHLPYWIEQHTATLGTIAALGLHLLSRYALKKDSPANLQLIYDACPFPLHEGLLNAVCYKAKSCFSELCGMWWLGRHNGDGGDASTPCKYTPLLRMLVHSGSSHLRTFMLRMWPNGLDIIPNESADRYIPDEMIQQWHGSSTPLPAADIATIKLFMRTVERKFGTNQDERPTPLYRIIKVVQ